MPYTFKRIAEFVRPNGFYYVEDHGADVAGVFFLGLRKRKAVYIATASVSKPDSVQRRVTQHARREFGLDQPKPGVVYEITGNGDFRPLA